MFGRRRRRRWEAHKHQVLTDAMENHDQSTGTCMDCGLPIRLHPPGRHLSSKPQYCEAARTRSAEEAQ